MSKTLVIAEKPSVANDLARVLGKFEKQTYGKESYAENAEYVISSAVGHLLEIQAPEGFEPARGKWKLENLPSMPPEFALAPKDKTLSRLKLLRHLLKRKDVTRIINACDAGREGELIFRNVIADAACTKPLQRLWLQSMTPTAIREGFTRLRSDEEMRPLADAAVSRSESDWLVGINATRALTAFNTRLVGGFQKTTAGRVQTPTLAILVERELKIRSFKVQTYWEVLADFGVEAGTYRGRWFDERFAKDPANEDAKAERIWDRALADTIVARCHGRPGIVEELKKSQSQAPPLLYDLTTLQREANGRFGLPATRTLQIAQALYERHKVLTYPRTDSRYLPEDYPDAVRRVLGSLRDPALAPHAQKALSEGWVRPNKRIFNNAKVSDHFAIVPTGEDPEGLDDLQRKIYDMVARRFVAVFHPAAQFEVTSRITRVEADAFKTDGKVIVFPGWLAVYGKEAETDDPSGKAIVPVKPGESARTEHIEAVENQTRPAPRFNEGTLLSAMEGAGKLVEDEELRLAMADRGLGTPATRASIIEGLIYEGYIERRGKDLIAMEKGISLITLLRNLKAEMLTKPELTGEWEHRLKEMEHGRLSRATFMEGIRGLTLDLVDKVKGFHSEQIEGDWVSLDVPCPKCGKGPFREDYRTWTCQACSLRLWKSLAGREFSPGEITELLSARRVGPLDGFVSKMGRRFAATVTLDDEQKVIFEFARDAEAEAKTSEAELAGKEPIAVCPVCKEGRVFELERNFTCERTLQSACTFRTGREILQRAISADQIRKLCATGKTDLIPRFISKKNGRPFSAYLTLKDGKVGFEFEERKPGAKSARGGWRKKAPVSKDGQPPA